MNATRKILLASLVALLAVGASICLAQVSQKPFPIYDNMSYKEKPDTKKAGLILSNVIYEDKIWPNHQQVGMLPDHETFLALVRATNVNPGPW
jgi:hypothetical protein